MAIDAVRMVREIRDRNYAATKDMSPEERRQYYAAKARKAMERVEAIRRERKGR